MNPYATTEDAELLTEFFRTHHEGTLRALMNRHLPLVYSVALRITGSPELSAEAAQDVFLKLTRRPALMKSGIPFMAWLHRSTRHRAIDLMRSEQARKSRERLAAENAVHAPETLSTEALIMLDEVVDRLPARDRELVLERYFAGRPLAEIGAAAGLSEDAVRMRLTRALEKMRALFGARGIATSASLLAASLPLQAVVRPPLKFSALIQAKVLAGGTGAAAQASLLNFLSIMTSTQKAVAVALIALIAGIAGGAYHHHSTPTSSPPAIPSGSSAAGPASPRPAPMASAGGTPSAADERIRVERIRQWLVDTGPEKQDEEMLHKAAVRRLSLAAVRELLADPALLADIQGPERADGFPNPVYPRRELLGRFLWEQFGKLSPKEALERLLAAEGPPRGDLQHAGPTLEGVAKTDPAGAIHFLKNLPSGLEYLGPGYSVDSLMTELAKHSPEEAFSLIANLPPMTRKDAYFGFVNSLGAGTDWQGEIARLQQELPELAASGFDQVGVAGALAGAWACHDPEAAFTWVASDKTDSNYGYVDAIGYWMHRNPSEAIRWLKTWDPVNVPRDRVYSRILVYGGADDIQVVDGLLELIKDPGARTEAVKNSMKNMGEGMEVEALLHLQRSPLLSDEAKQAIGETLAAKEASSAAK